MEHVKLIQKIINKIFDLKFKMLAVMDFTYNGSTLVVWNCLSAFKRRNLARIDLLNDTEFIKLKALYKELLRIEKTKECQYVL